MKLLLAPAFLAVAAASVPAHANVVTSDPDLRCVALLGVLQGAVEGGFKEVIIPADLDANGERWSEIAFSALLEESGATEAEIDDAFFALAEAEAEMLMDGKETREVRQARVDQCLARMDAALLAADK